MTPKHYTTKYEPKTALIIKAAEKAGAKVVTFTEARPNADDYKGMPYNQNQNTPQEKTLNLAPLAALLIAFSLWGIIITAIAYVINP